ncbi:hypothetical protein [Halorubrum lacusprofundi]|uniref:hypothetical protein n=1 Tax=Halorubrum lacusprofundi TaxID=2247 RepID=UPI001F25B094|nr:hypothetical protein [Halorubrum lacusprofundi]MCG1008143.1 hypothetical protein [Halorubrum lacusprofundi]
MEEADRELILVIGHAPVFTDGLRDRLKAACRRGVTLIVGVVSEALQTRVEEELPEAEVSVSGLDSVPHKASSASCFCGLSSVSKRLY